MKKKKLSDQIIYKAKSDELELINIFAETWLSLDRYDKNLLSAGGKELYGSVEEKAAHLLYFMVKNHPFIDGNKRSGAYAFVWFLRQANVLDTTRLTPPALTALTILVAESNPKDKERIVGLVMALIAKRK